MEIKNCDYIGTYKNREVYRCYDSNVGNISRCYANYLFAYGNELFRNGCKVGDLKGKTVVNYIEEKVQNKAKEREENIEKADALLNKVMKRSIDDLIGERLSVERDTFN